MNLNKLVYYLGKLNYLLATNLYFIAVRLAAPFNKRAKLLIEGQSKIWTNLSEFNPKPSQKVIWVHAASLGEFEQAVPVIKAIKQKQEVYVVVSFFSPSGYEHRKNHPLINFATYLPFDGYSNANKFINAISPSLVIWVKYEFWFYYLYGLNQKQIPVYLISALFRKDQLFFKKIGQFQKSLLGYFNYIFCQNSASVEMLHNINLNNTLLTGDTRFENVVHVKENTQKLQLIELFKGGNKLLALGSSYDVEEKICFNFFKNYKPDLKIAIAPHFVDTGRINQIKDTFKIFNPICYSECTEQTDFTQHNILIVDSIGKLNAIYKSADFAFIGGGFWQGGLHNCLEAAVNEIPICFGQKINRFPEALLLVENGIANYVTTPEQLNDWYMHASNEQILIEIKDKCRNFIQSGLGSTQKIMNTIFA